LVVATAADCAALTLRAAGARPRNATAFLYSPSNRTCSPRAVDPARAGTGLCPSTSGACRAAALALAPDAAVDGGATMYWADAGAARRCAVRAEEAQACSALPPGEYSPHRAFTANGTGLPNALDLFYVVASLHAETADDAAAAAAALRGPPTAELRAFLRQYGVVQIAVAGDGALAGGQSAEGDLQAAGNLDAAAAALLDCSSARACGAGCECGRAVDDDAATCVPMAAGSFLSAAFVAAGTGDVDLMLVTRVDVGLCLLADGAVGECRDPPGPSADEEPVAVSARLEFSDGSARLLSLAPAAAPLVVYVEPAVTHFARLVLTGPAWPPVGLFRFAAAGRPLRALLASPAERVDIFAPLPAPPPGLPPVYPCPPTTYADPAGRACVPCPYPTVSGEGSSSAANCSCPRCGDGRLHWQAGEECDDGNAASGDGCSAACAIEVLQFCMGPRDPATGVGLPRQSYAQRDQCLRLGSYWTAYGAGAWAPRAGAAGLVHQGALWVVGGMGGPPGYGFSNEAWFETTNGAFCTPSEPEQSCAAAGGGGGASPLTWAQAGEEPFPARAFHAAVSFNGSLWVAGGARRGAGTAVQPCVVSRGDFDCFLDATLRDGERSRLPRAEPA
jgi:cysteine-rich repeat protein